MQIGDNLVMFLAEGMWGRGNGWRGGEEVGGCEASGYLKYWSYGHYLSLEAQLNIT